MTFPELDTAPPDGDVRMKFADIGAMTRPGSLNSKRRTCDVVMTKRMVDRDGEIIEPKAFEETIEEYKSNPVVFFNHNRQAEPPIGRVVPETIRISHDEMVGTIQFRPKGRHGLTDRVFDAIEDGVLRSVSIGFKALEVKQEKGVDGEFGPLIITKGTLVELSVVNIPANPAAVVKGYAAIAKNLGPAAIAAAGDGALLDELLARLRRKDYGEPGYLADVGRQLDELRDLIYSLPFSADEQRAQDAVAVAGITSNLDAAMRRIRAI